MCKASVTRRQVHRQCALLLSTDFTSSSHPPTPRTIPLNHKACVAIYLLAASLSPTTSNRTRPAQCLIIVDAIHRLISCEKGFANNQRTPGSIVLPRASARPVIAEHDSLDSCECIARDPQVLI